MRLPFTDRSLARARRSAAVLAAAGGLAASLAGALSAHRAEGASGYNVMFILTDDQTLSEMSAMPNTQLLLVNAGVSFRRAYSSYPLCCPARATLMSGQYMHNHGVRGNLPPLGGWPRFFPQEGGALPAAMDSRGYYDVHIGKYLNSYTDQGFAAPPVPPGWDQWYGKISEESLYFNYQLVEKPSPTATPRIVFYGSQPGDYQTDAFRDKALEFLSKLSPSQTPFMMNVWFNAPHGPFEPAPRHLYSLAGAALPPLPGFNEKDISDKPKWLQRQAKKRIKKSTRQLITDERKRREEQLLSVDDAVGRIVNGLAAQGVLDDTYIVFASDNGFFRGEHRIVGGKYLPYEPSSHIPLIIRGPGIPAGQASDELVSLGDIPQTILDISGDADPTRDGRSLLPYAQSPGLRSTRPILLEGDTGGTVGAEPANAVSSKVRVAGRRGVKNLDQEPDPIRSMKSVASGNGAPAYRAIRTDRYLFVVYANGQTEMYDMLLDPAQVRSVAGDPRYRIVRKWLLAQLVPLSNCAGGNCNLNIGVEPLPRRGPKPKKGKGGGGGKKGGGKKGRKR